TVGARRQAPGSAFGPGPNSQVARGQRGLGAAVHALPETIVVGGRGVHAHPKSVRAGVRRGQVASGLGRGVAVGVGPRARRRPDIVAAERQRRVEVVVSHHGRRQGARFGLHRHVVIGAGGEGVVRRGGGDVARRVGADHVVLIG